MKIIVEHISGFELAMKGMRLSYGSESDTVPLDEDGNGIGLNDYKLAQSLIKKGASHRKFLRFIRVVLFIEAPLYWWKQFDTYKVGVDTLSSSTMHTIMKAPIHPDMFEGYMPDHMIEYLRRIQKDYLDEKDPQHKHDLWYEMIRMLPSSFLQSRYVSTNYEVLRNICQQRRDHKLYEWHKFIDAIYNHTWWSSFLITGD